MASTMKSRKEVEDLKAQWYVDPIWDLASTEGFDGYRTELETFARVCEAEWAEQRQRELEEYARKIGIPDNLTLAQYIQSLEARISRLGGR